MSVWIERFENHQIHNKLSGLIKHTEKLLNENNDHRLERISQVLELLQINLQNCDPTFTPIPNLDTIAQYLDNILSNFNQFERTRNLSYLDTAYAYGENILPQMTLLNVPKSPTDIEGIREAIISFRRSIGQNKRTIHEELEEFKREISNLRVASSEVNQSYSELASTLATQKNDFDAYIETIKDNFESKLSTYLDEFSQKLDTFHERFEIEEEDRKRQFEESLEKYRQICDAEIDAGLNKLENHVQTFKDDLKAQAENIFTELENMKKLAEELTNAIGNLGIARGFQEIAKESRKTKRFWRGVAAASMLCTAIYAAIYALTFDTTATWHTLTAKILPAFAIGSLAAYASRQAALAYQDEKYNRKMELELKSIHPYLVGLPKESQVTIKDRLADRFFGNDLTAQPQDNKTQSQDSPTLNVHEVIGKLFETLLQNKK
ncbi:prefoldin subunit 5 [Brevibacillus aydinogluensis]|uniref:hypothetical protein n=1 Tax=Brevibacillus aydinogluensis TaxID=927786 RepID=UPI002892BA6E|nr:hypothetical protein [Brevibacillus aydinogluensis]MDT3417095.1 prefoldin subunit 5 [Brevibacillus aydinogluensis]